MKRSPCLPAPPRGTQTPFNMRERKHALAAHEVGSSRFRASKVVVMTIATAMITLVSTIGTGEPSSGDRRESQTEFRSQTIPIDIPGRGLVARLERTKKWTLSIGDLEGIRVFGQTPIPEWTAATTYEYSVETHLVGGIQTLVFTATPTGLGSNDETWWSIWTPSSEKVSSTWFQVVTGVWSPIEGGDELLFRKGQSSWELIRRRDRPGARFCGTSEFAFERFDAKARVFRQSLDAKQLTHGAAQARVVLPKVPFEAPTLVHFYRWHSASSDRHNPSDAPTVIRPNELGDGDLSSAWTEGAPGYGQGEFVTARISPHFAVTGVRLFPGAGASPETYKSFARPRTLLLTLGKNQRYTVDLPEVTFDKLRENGGLLVTFDSPVTTTCLSVVLLESTAGRPDPGGKLEWAKSFVAISEFTPLSEIHGIPQHDAVNRIAERLLAPDLPQKSIVPLLALAAKLEEQIVARLDGGTRRASPKTLQRIVDVLARVTSDAAVKTLVRLFFRADLGETERRTIKKALRQHPEATQKLLLAALSTPPLDPRHHADALRILGRGSQGTGLLTLLGRLGSGPDLVRMERVRALARSGDAAVNLLRQWPIERFEGPAGTDALRVLVMFGRYARGRAENAQRDVNPWPTLIALTEAGRPRSLRVLAIRALGIHPTPDTQAALTDRIENDADPIIRSFSIQSLATLRESPHTIYAKALLDSSPDVRIAAVRNIAKLPPNEAGTFFDDVLRYTERETWPVGLELGYRILAPDTRARNTLIDVMRHEGDPRRPIIARVMARTGTPLPFPILEDLLHGPTPDPSICRYAIDHLGLLVNAQSKSLLIAILQGERFLGMDADSSLRLRARATHALGRHRDHRAYEELQKIATNRSEPITLRVAAVRSFALFRDEAIVQELDGVRSKLTDPVLVRELEDSQRMIQRRALLKEIEAGIEPTPKTIEAENSNSGEAPKPRSAENKLEHVEEKHGENGGKGDGVEP
jgi:HEAT repeat protein